jgi:hypothetical protein
MALLSKKTDEQKALDVEGKTQRSREKEERRLAGLAERERSALAEQAEREQKAFNESAAGQARMAVERGDHVFQYSIDVMNQQAIVHSMASLAPTGAKTKARTNDPTGVLNSVCDEGWELVTGSFVFVEQGETSRKQALSSKVQVAVKGTVIGYYLFKRSEHAAARFESPTGLGA